MKSLWWEGGGGEIDGQEDRRTGPRQGWQLKLLIKIIQTLLRSNNAQQQRWDLARYFQMKMTNLRDNDVSERLKISSQTLIVLRPVH